MLARTHVSVTLFTGLIFFTFTPMFLLVSAFATLFPDIDSKFSVIGKRFKFLNFFIKHRGIIHSLTFLFGLSILLFIFFKEFLLPFAFGYSVHLILDSLTLTGIRPIFPFKFRIRGKIKTGGIFETVLFVLSLIGILFVLINRFFNIL